jgi:AAHS family 4-hydroxybenzoate transporter-like MFS transporter
LGQATDERFTTTDALYLRVALLCASVAMFDGFDILSAAYVVPNLLREWNLQQSTAGIVLSAGLVGISIGALTLSPLADRFGHRQIIMVSALIFGAFSLVSAWASGPQLLIVLRVLTGIGLGGAMPTLVALTTEYAPPNARGLVVSGMFVGFPIGTAVAGLIAGPVIERWGWPAMFAIGGILPLLLLPILWRWLPDSRLRPSGHGIDLKTGDGAVRAARTKIRGSTISALFTPANLGLTVALWSVFFLNLLTMYVLSSWLPAFLSSAGYSVTLSALSGAAYHVGGLVGGLGLGRLLDRWAPTEVLKWAYLLGALGVGVLGIATLPYMLTIALIAIVGACTIGGQIALNAYAALAYPSAIRSTGVGWALGMGRLGSILGPLTVGLMLDRGWHRSEIVVLLAIPLTGAAIGCVVLSRTGHQRPLAQPA